MVEFVSYTGKFPTLCYGVLTLKINGKEYIFGGYSKYNHRSFWMSGGCAGWDGTNEYCSQGEWEIDAMSLPPELVQYADEISTVFNTNVPYGCCGGCI